MFLIVNSTNPNFKGLFLNSFTLFSIGIKLTCDNNYNQLIKLI